MEKNVIITISRQFGSNGREIARKLAEYLDISYYNKQISLITNLIKQVHTYKFTDIKTKK